MQEQYHHLFFRRLQIAIQFLTRLPVWLKQPPVDKDIGCSASFYPLVGLIIGLILFVIAWLLQYAFSHIPASLLAALILFSWVIITGALHLDGLADSVDGFMGAINEPEKMLQIMQDSRSGPMAVVALILVLLLKWVALENIIEQHLNWVIIFIPAVARAYILLLLTTTDYVSKQGLASIMLDNFPHQKHINTILFISASLFVFSLGFWLLLASLMVFFILRYLMLKKIQGCNGDTIGAMVEMIEMSCLVFLVL